MSLEHTLEQLRHLKLIGMIAGLEHQRSQSSYGGLGFDQRLGHLVGAEVSQRESQRFKRLIANARLKVFAETEAIDYHSGRGLDRAMAADLLTCGWIERQQNLLILVPARCGWPALWPSRPHAMASPSAIDGSAGYWRKWSWPMPMAHCPSRALSVPHHIVQDAAVGPDRRRL